MENTPSTSNEFKMSDSYHGELRQEFLSGVLIDDGDFLVRRTSDGVSVISVKWEHRFLNYKPDFDGQTYSLGDRAFPHLEHVVIFHQKNQIPLGQEMALLKRPIKHRKVMYKADNIEIFNQIGEGNYGKVYKVLIKSENRYCAMKTMNSKVNHEAREFFISEMDMMATMQHKNVVQYVGYVECKPEERSQTKFLIEYINKGSLDKLLEKNRLTDKGKTRLLMHVSQGMAYLHDLKIIHRDLAARNILIHQRDDGSLVAKVSDFGLSRKDESGRGYQLQSSKPLPLQWIAPECFVRRSWTAASDVWSFGVLFWEAFTNGAQPYLELNLDVVQLAKYISEGGFPTPLLPNMHAGLHDIMTSCFKYQPAERPKMRDLTLQLRRIYPTVKSGRTKIESGLVLDVSTKDFEKQSLTSLVAEPLKSITSKTTVQPPAKSGVVQSAVRKTCKG